MTDGELLATLAVYADLMDQQSEMIRRLIRLCADQQTEIQQYKSVAVCEDIVRQENAERIITDAMQILEREP